jgi:hypothetical protein
MYFLLLGALLSTGYGAPFLESQLPLELVRVTPNEVSLLHGTSEGSKTNKLQGANPITAVFSRPVIALGSDWGSDQLADMPLDKQPFMLSFTDGTPLSSKVSGKIRWPTTYTARFDPDYNWPTDLDIVMTVNPGLTTFDGVRLTNPNDVPMQVLYSTDGLTGSLATVTSVKAEQLTGGQWSPTFASTNYPDLSKTQRNKPEVPPDGKIQIQFSQGVSQDFLQASLQLANAEGKPARLSFSLEECVQRNDEIVPYFSSSSSYSDADNKEASDDPKCHVVVPTGLERRQAYTLTFPKGSQYNAFSGATKTDITFHFTGLQSFQFVSGNGKAGSNAWNLFLIHGLKEGTEPSSLEAALQIRDSRNRPVEFEILRPSNGTLQVRSATSFMPNEEYTMYFNSAAFVDGFDQLLLSPTLKVNTATKDGFFQSVNSDTYSNFLAYEKSQFAWNDWRIFSRGDSKPSPSASSISIGPVKSFSTAIASTESYKTLYPDITTTIKRDNSDLTYKVLKAPIPGFSFIKQKESHSSFSSQLITLTDLAVSAIRYDESMLVWVTDFDDGNGVEGATLKFYDQPQSYGRDSTAAKLLHTGVTGADGTYEWKNPTSERIVIVASKNGIDGVLNQYFYSYDSQVQTGTIVVDRKVYKQGDTVYVTAYMRTLGEDKKSWQLPSSDEAKLEVTWSYGTAPYYKSLKSTVPVKWDEFGTFNTELVIPDGATSGMKNVNLMTKAKGNSWFRQVTSAMVKIADPRRPTATRAFAGESPILRISAPS